MRAVTPEVFLISKTSDLEINEYMKSIGSPAWQPDDSVSDSENLVEAAGRMCYRSWEPYNSEKKDATNPNVTRVRKGNAAYIANLLETGHGCYDKETEVLTKDGWKFWADVTMTDEFATINTKSYKISYQKPSRLVRFTHKGRMYQVDSPEVDLLVTPNHKMFACETRTKTGRKKENYGLIMAWQLDCDSHAYMKNAAPVASDDLLESDIAFGKLLGFAIGDGHYSQERLEFHLRKERKISYLRSICDSAGLKLEEDGDKFYVRFSTVYEKQCFENMYQANGEKQIPINITAMCFEELEALYDGLINSDGCTTDTGICYDTVSAKLAGQFQQLCLHLGKSANISQADCYKDRTTSFGTKPIYRCYVIERNNRPIVNKVKGAKGRTNWIENWEGEVFCAEVPNHTLYVRRNGKPVWSGNSVLEHANMTFVLKDVSRVVTHELVRHRAGCAYSQESLRYVRLTDIKASIPDCFAKNPEALALFTSTIEHLEFVQSQLAEIYKTDLGGTDFARKKELTSAFRRLAPIGLATSITFTANIRALRHIIEMRTAMAAEAEIRLVFKQVATICKTEHPNFFSDMTIGSDGVCSFEHST
jgi:flavin-dependent thymidylate synthase